MRKAEALGALSLRIRSRVLAWLVAALILLSWASFTIGIWASHHLPGFTIPIPFRPSELLLGFLGPFLLLWVSPLAWQWTGDERPAVPVGRALLQALVLWVPWWVMRLVLALPAMRATMANPKLPGLLPIAVLTGFSMGYVIFLLTGYAITTWERRVAGREAARARAKEAQWVLLRGQMSPHVLLNSLGGLAELVREDLDAGLRGMRDLAEIYRQLMEMGEKPQVPLSAERALLERYLSVERMRLGEALVVEWAWDRALDERLVMPLLLQPLVENAVKHGIAANPEGGRIRISAQEAQDGLQLLVENTGAPLGQERTRGTGVGLQNLETRLRLAFGEAARFTLRREEPWTRAEIHLPGSRI